jgi:hypothetical protein
MNSSTFSTINPATGEQIETFPFFTAEETESALTRAEKRFKCYRKLCVHQRAELSARIANRPRLRTTTPRTRGPPRSTSAVSWRSSEHTDLMPQRQDLRLESGARTEG